MDYTFYKTDMTEQITAYLSKTGFTGHQAIVAEDLQEIKTYVLCDGANMPYYDNQCIEDVINYIDMNAVAKLHMEARH
jgi:hypothetical protein